MQVKIAIVEDNPITLKVLQSTIRWEEINCVIVGTATNGEIGRQMLLKVKPDILLTDIRMPQTDGLSMLESVREALPEMKTIVITGYSEFQYASRAIKLAVSDYILKPIHHDELILAVQRVIRLLHRQSENRQLLEQADLLRRKAQLLLLLNNDSRPGQDIHRAMKELDLFSSSYYLMVLQSDDPKWIMMATLNGMDDLLSSFSVQATSVVLDNSVVIYVMLHDGSEGWQESAERMAKKIIATVPASLTVGISPCMTTHHHIREVYQQVYMMLLERAFSPQEASILFLNPETSFSGNPSSHQLLAKQLAGRAELNEASAQEIAQALWTGCHENLQQLHSLLSLFVLFLLKKYICHDGDLLKEALSEDLSAAGSEEVFLCVSKLFSALKDEEFPKKREDTYSPLVRDALSYIRLHAAEQLKLREVADHFLISANYLSTLIHQETGTSYYHHVLRAKMDIAHTMLDDPRIRVEEVAYAIGYSTYSAFFNAFQRTEHMTPTEYRKKLRRGNAHV